MGNQKIIKQLTLFRQKISYQTPITKMILFGSRAWGRPHRDSDIDLIVVSPSFRRVRRLKRGIDFYWQWNLDYPVDFLCYTPEEFQKLRKQISIVKEAVERGIEIKDK